MSGQDVISTIKEKGVKYVDFRFCDTKGKEQHVTVPAHTIDDSVFTEGKMFDGSSISGWKGINESDMILMPDTDTAFIDPFFEDPTLVLTCDVLEPSTGQGYDRDPRSLAKRAEAYLKSTGIADTAYFGPENEFFVFDSVRWGTEMKGCFVEIDSEEAAWNSSKAYEAGNMGHRPTVKGGYFPVPPVDQLHDIRAAMCDTLDAIGVPVEVHHHEVANAGQCEIGVKFNTLTLKADEVLKLKYVVQNVAHQFGKTATFMPKPIVGDNGSGKRLVPGFEAPVLLAYSARNRSASIRIPFIANPKGRRIEVRFPDSLANPYLAFTAMMMAGLDGIQNKIHPGGPSDKDLYHLPPEEDKKIPRVCHSLDMALEALDKDREFLKAGGVFTDDLIDAYIELKMGEVTRFRMTTHPLEFDMYYSM